MEHKWIGNLIPEPNPSGSTFCTLFLHRGEPAQILVSLPQDCFDILKDHHGELREVPAGKWEVWGKRTSGPMIQGWLRGCGLWEIVASASVSKFGEGCVWEDFVGSKRSRRVAA